MRKSFLIILHLALTIATYTSWLWLGWGFVALIGLVHIAYLEVYQGCHLSRKQFGNSEDKFYEWWMSKLGIKVKDRQKTRIFMTYVVPLIVAVIALVWQVVLGFAPLLQILPTPYG
ncbi:hypothetical protein FWH13_00730 [Candidatus Saccharibacteria bacterium]|nr:hypothetical protein [Candidatus Saccharibacteria bacterium]